MATLIPDYSACASRMTPGERRFAQRLESKLEDDYLCWYDVPIGQSMRHPDFMVLHPRRGLLILEVKDWKLDTIQSITRSDADQGAPEGNERRNPHTQIWSAVSDPYARIFLLSHMRAFTSLAGHIFGSHPQINGYYEMRISYEDASALGRQPEIFRQGDVLKPGSRYLFDKLLHNDYVLKPEQLGSVELKILVSLAEPTRTIRSIVHLFRQKPDPDLYASPLRAANYYVARLKALADFCRTAERGYRYFDAEMLQAAPERLLPKLSHWLELDSPLSERYQTFSQTGKAGRGDSSARIHGGRIDRTRVDYAHIAIPEDALSAAQAAYRECREQIVSGASDSVLNQGLSTLISQV